MSGCTKGPTVSVPVSGCTKGPTVPVPAIDVVTRSPVAVMAAVTVASANDDVLGMV